jgi:hypothetical protein
MTMPARSLVELAARLLEPNDREAVLGDWVQAGQGPWRGLVEILGLVIRRETALWNNWRPWLAAFGMAWPCTLLLLGVSFSIGRTYQRLAGPTACTDCSPTWQADSLFLSCHVALLIVWSWTVGFVVGSVSRRTLWVSGISCLLPCVYCLWRFNETSPSRLCLLLFLPPAILGVRRSLRITPIKPRAALALAAAMTVSMFLAWRIGALWVLTWALMAPAGCVVLLAWRPARQVAGRSA